MAGPVRALQPPRSEERFWPEKMYDPAEMAIMSI